MNRNMLISLALHIITGNLFLLCQNLQKMASQPKIGGINQKICTAYKNATLTEQYVVNDINPLKDDSTVYNHMDVVSIAVQLTASRMYMLELLANHWSGPITFVYYSEEPKSLLRFVEASSVLKVRGNIKYRHVLRRTSPAFYPVNILRNIAIKSTTTTFVIPLDVDYLPRKGMYERLRRFIALSGKCTSRKAYVIPLFEPATDKNLTREELIKLYPSNKAALLKIWKNGFIQPFTEKEWKAGHFQTNYLKWKSARVPYSVVYKWHYEPTVMYNYAAFPEAEYDPRFVGYGDEKATLPAIMAANDFDFIVLPDEFVIHVPHPTSPWRLRENYEFTSGCRVKVVKQMIREIKLMHPSFQRFFY